LTGGWYTPESYTTDCKVTFYTVPIIVIGAEKYSAYTVDCRINFSFQIIKVHLSKFSLFIFHCIEWILLHHPDFCKIFILHNILLTKAADVYSMFWRFCAPDSAFKTFVYTSWLLFFQCKIETRQITIGLCYFRKTVLMRSEPSSTDNLVWYIYKLKIFVQGTSIYE
jgi:hypothetical protein